MPADDIKALLIEIRDLQKEQNQALRETRLLAKRQHDMQLWMTVVKVVFYGSMVLFTIIGVYWYYKVLMPMSFGGMNI